jgi:putative colanic acid biosynthesis acetyltransferase WcaF
MELQMNPNEIEPHQVLDAGEHRRNDNYGKGDFLRRLLWIPAKVLLRVIPRFLYGLRNAILRLYGAKIGQRVRIYPSVRIIFPWTLDIGDDVTIGDEVKLYGLGPIRIGDSTMVSQGVHFCAGTHDYHFSNLPLLKPEIRVGRAVWICADSFIGPGVNVGDFCIIGARSVVIKDIEPMKIAAGNPARAIRERPMPRAFANN